MPTPPPGRRAPARGGVRAPADGTGPAVRGAGTATATATDAAIGVVTAGVLLAGLARPGYPLLRDWVATPSPPLSDAALGLGESAARAVPQDVALAWASRALGAVGLPTWPLTGLLTALFCVWLAVAAGALVRRTVPGADGPGVAPVLLRGPAVVLAVWNPYVVERLLQGHWSLLAGVAAAVTLPVLLARPRPRVAAAVAALAAASLTPTGWLLAIVSAAVSLVAAPAARARAAVILALAAVVAASPWLLATALAGAPDVLAETGVRAFAARAEPGIGTAGSLFALGGIWNSGAVPGSRGTWWTVPALALLVVVWAVAARGLWRSRAEPTVRATLPLAAVVWAAVTLAATGPGLALLDAAVGAVPALGLLRDTQKLMALALPAVVLAAAFAARALAARLRPVGAGVAVLAVVVAAVPDAPAALWRHLVPVTYPADWAEVDAIIAAGPDPAAGANGDVLVLPVGSFRLVPGWAGGAPVLDPAPRMLDARVPVSGDLVVGGATPGAGEVVAGEGGRAAAASAVLAAGGDPAELTALGFRWVLDETASAGPRGASAETLRATTTRFSGSDLVLHELPGPLVPAATASGTDRALVLAAHAAWLLLGAGAGVIALARGLSRRG